MRSSESQNKRRKIHSDVWPAGVPSNTVAECQEWLFL